MSKIYESPDGGKTVFERDTQTGERIEIVKPYIPEWHIDDHTLSKINDLAKSGNKALQKALKELKILYNLTRDNDE